MTDPRQKALGDFLRSRRERLDPAALAITSARRRRTVGLRREEVAERAGIGVDWYVRLEQGRSVQPSVTTVDALARALCLSGAEHAHLRSLARGPDWQTFECEQVSPTIRRLVADLHQPAYVTGRRWGLLAWTPQRRNSSTSTGCRRRSATSCSSFDDPRARALFGDSWAGEARRMVAQFRATYDLWAADPAVTDLLTRLQRGCPPLDVWWDAHEVRAGGTGRKALHHPWRGLLRFEYATFQANDDPRLKLAIYALVGNDRRSPRLG